MVDTLASGASARKGVEVQVLSWAPIKLGNVNINQMFTDFLLYLLPNLLPKTWDDSGLFIQERLAPVRLVRNVQLVYLRTIAGGEGANRCCDCDGYRPDTVAIK